MKYKKICYSTQLDKLYGKEDYVNHLEVGREYWWSWFSSDSDEYQYTGQSWNRIKITFKRSGAIFYVLPEYPDFPEHYFSDKSFIARTLIYAQIDPIKDLDWKSFDDRPKKELEKRYCFDNERTEVLNWNNSRESDIDEKELDLYDQAIQYINDNTKN